MSDINDYCESENYELNNDIMDQSFLTHYDKFYDNVCEFENDIEEIDNKVPNKKLVFKKTNEMDKKIKEKINFIKNNPKQDLLKISKKLNKSTLKINNNKFILKNNSQKFLFQKDKIKLNYNIVTKNIFTKFSLNSKLPKLKKNFLVKTKEIN